LRHDVSGATFGMPVFLTARSACPKGSADRLSNLMMYSFGLVAVLKALG
jgi:hypothetical protein